MSLEMTFRQKLIRIACSASICGLSFSFVVGEVVDREAKRLRSWAIDPALIPSHYLPAQPMLAAFAELQATKWRENLLAINSLITVPSPEPAAAVSKATIKAEIIKIQSAAPSLTSSREAVPLIKEAPLPAADVEKLLASIHSATTKLSAMRERSPSHENAPEISKSHEPKTLARPAPPERKAATKTMAAAEAAELTSATEESGVWVLNGRILSSTAEDAEAGHYEVGLYSKIDQDGKPVGYPQRKEYLPEGQTTFRLKLPASVDKGYLFAEFVSAKSKKRTWIAPATNPWTKENRQIAELFYRTEDSITSIASAASIVRETPKETWRIHGSVTTMFVSGGASIPQADVVVKVRGRKEAARTSGNGSFSLEVPRMKGTLYLEVLKAGYHPSIVGIAADDSKPIKIEIASRYAIEQISQRLGANQGSSKGVFVGRMVGEDGTGLRGVIAQLSLKADGPFYFDDNGVATREARATGSNGSFLFLNVEPGTGYLEATMNSEPVAPLQVSMVDGGELVQKTLVPSSGSLSGRIFNPVETNGKLVPVGGARVRIDGASEWVNSDSFGAFSIGPLKWFKGERIALEVSAEKFNNHRYLVSADKPTQPLNLFAFPAAYVNKLARTMDIDFDPYAGLIIGKVGGPGLRMDALADHSTVNHAKDFYFDAKGRLRGSHEMTDPKFGTYIIFNVPKGRALLQGNDSAGQLRYSDSVVANPASINIQMD